MPILQNTEVVKILIKRGPEANLPILDIGELAFTTDTNRYFVGSEIGNYELGSMDDIDSVLVELKALGLKLSKQDLRTATLTGGVQVLEADQAGPLSVNFVGRTLTSLGNSNLEASKYYTLTDEKTKLIVDKQTVGGVGKFQKGQTTKTLADFVGKVSGSNVANPHIGEYDNSTSLVSPLAFYKENGSGTYINFSRLDGEVQTYPVYVNGEMPQQLFSFSVIGQVERELGLIPRETLSEKVQWVKDNVQQVTGNWHGFGSSVGGNKASLAHWIQINNAWTVSPLTHMNSAVSKLSRTLPDGMGNYLDANGFVHFLVYAEPSDGTTPSVINTDYVSLDIELKSAARLNTRGRIIRVENFEGKVAGSKVENPHFADSYAGSSLPNPVNERNTFNTANYDLVSKINGDSRTTANNVSGNIAYQQFSFNLIEAVERNIGKIPANGIVGKVEWLRGSTSLFKASWRGYGSSPTGSRGSFAINFPGDTLWYRNKSHNHSVVTELTQINDTDAYVRGYISSEGFVHYVAYAEPSDGVTASVIHTDYIELEIELKPDADFHAPKVPLYEVTKEEYDKIGLQWNDTEVKRRFPIVEGTQHLTNPYVKVEGKNLFNTDMPYPLVTFGVAGHGTAYEIQLTPNTTYTVTSVRKDQGYDVGTIAYSYITNSAKSVNKMMARANHSLGSTVAHQVTTLADGVLLMTNYAGSPETYLQIQIELGSTSTLFVPHNLDYLYAEATLGAIRNQKDVLFKEDGKWKAHRAVATVNLDGNISWSNIGNYNYAVASYTPNQGADITASARLSVVSTSDRGRFLRNTLSNPSPEFIADQLSLNRALMYPTGAGNFYLYVSKDAIGVPLAHVPTGEDFKRYFNGWKYSDGITWTSVTGNGQTATAQVALDTKPTGYTPYKLSYMLAKPIVEEVYVEGDLSIQGDAQIEIDSGIVVREKVDFVLSGNGNYELNKTTDASTHLNHRAVKILNVFKNGIVSDSWELGAVSYFRDNIGILFRPNSNFDPTAEYTVTYLAKKENFTVSVTELPVWYSQSLPSSFSAIVTGQSDVATANSLQVRAIAEMYKQLNSLG